MNNLRHLVRPEGRRAFSSRQAPRIRPAIARLVILVLLLPLLAACGFGDSDDNGPTGQIVWQEGTPPPDLAAAPPTDVGQAVTTAPTELPAAPTLAPTEPPVPTLEPTPAVAEAVTGRTLTPEELAQYQPNELGSVPVLMYHNIIEEYGEGQQGDVLWRTADEFRADLEFLYENNFYVVPFRDYVTNQIAAPAGKHPVVLTFDDSRPNQFRYLAAADGSLQIDPTSAVGILEAFFDAHPDFGRTAFFSILPIWCFDFEEPDQTQYCQQKLQWLEENGYEIGNHTWDHQDLGDVSNEVFQTKIVDASAFLTEMVPATDTANLLILPYGVFPGGANADQQWQWIRNGWTSNGQSYQLLSVVAAGANPAPSPVSVDFDIMSIARIGAKDDPGPGEGNLFFNFWFGQFQSRPDLLYTSDGNPDTVTIPTIEPDALAGTFDEEKAIADGKEVIRY